MLCQDKLVKHAEELILCPPRVALGSERKEGMKKGREKRALKLHHSVAPWRRRSERGEGLMEGETAPHCTAVGLKCPVAYSIHLFPSLKEKKIFFLNDGCVCVWEMEAGGIR